MRGRSRVGGGRAAAVGEGGRRKVRRRRTQPLWALAFQPALLAHVARGDFPCLCRPDPGGQSPSRGGRHEAGGWAQNGINAHRLCSTERDKMSQQHGELDQLADRPLSMREVPGSKTGYKRGGSINSSAPPGRRAARAAVGKRLFSLFMYIRPTALAASRASICSFASSPLDAALSGAAAAAHG